MQVFDSIDALRTARRQLSGSVAFVPTMGYLHEGHLTLMRAAREKYDHLIVSIFVNPTQFGPTEDLERYPRDPEGDRRLCEQEGCELLFMPSSEMMYPPGYATSISVRGLTENLCGAARPGHFDGVATVVTKLFNIVQPDAAVFGEKDFQQLAVIRRMVADLNLEIDIIGCPIMREDDGLAMSSRNRFLSADDRKTALRLNVALKQAAHSYQQAGDKHPKTFGELVQEISAFLQADAALRIDYIECVHPATLAGYSPDQIITQHDPALVALAVFVGSTRLIDNQRLDYLAI